MLEILNKLFPKEEERSQPSKLVMSALEALRAVRDEHGVLMGKVRRVPSHFALNLSEEQYALLDDIDALRDLAFFFTDELMKDLSAEGMRTYGDRTIRVAIQSDESLGERELYAVVRKPADDGSSKKSGEKHSSQGGPDEESTRAFVSIPDGGDEGEGAEPTVILQGEENEMTVQGIPGSDATMEIRTTSLLRLQYPDGTTHEESIERVKWIAGRHGSSGAVLPPEHIKVNLDFPGTVSREQFRVEISDQSFVLERLGKATMKLADGTDLAEGESRRMEFGTSFFVEEIELLIVMKEG